MKHYPRAIIDLAALKHNLRCIRQFAPNSRVMSVIKADAYGHGVLQVAKALSESDAFAVARLSEALLLRTRGICKPITVLEGFANAAELELFISHQLTPVLHQAAHLELLYNATHKQSLPHAWFMLETGMHRLGLSPDVVTAAYEQLKSRTDISASWGLMSHFANSDCYQDARNAAQIAVMTHMHQQTHLAVCLANSAAIIQLSDAHGDWVRPGLMLYGVSPFEDKNGHELGLKPVMKVVARLIAVNDLSAGDEVGYGGLWTAPKNGKMGVVSIGYGDGFNRYLSNTGAVEINGIRCPVIGRVSMDTICIDLTDCPNAQLGNDVIIWGSDQLTVEWQAKQAGTIPYELMTALTRRVQREYRHGED